MKCREFRDNIEGLFDAGKYQLRAEMESHLRGCPGCAGFASDLLALQRTLNNQKFTIAPGELDFLDENLILSRMGETAKMPGIRKINIRFLRWAWIPAAVAAVIILLMVMPGEIRINGDLTGGYFAGDYLTDTEIEARIFQSDSLRSIYLGGLVDYDNEIEQASNELAADADIDEMLDWLSFEELERLDKMLIENEGSAG